MIFGTSSRIRRTFLFLLLAGAASIRLHAQESTLDVPDSIINKDSIRYIRIMVVPFNPSMYFSDADNDIGEVSHVDPGQVRNKVNASLEATVTEHLDLFYEVKGLSKQKEGEEDLDIIYGSVHYQPKAIPSPEPEKKSRIQQLKGHLNPEKNPAPKKIKDPETYMDIGFDDRRLIEYISSKYEVDYVIFFNQFEIKTDYENCIDLQMRNYYREIKLHYSVYSKDGKRVGGDVITLPYNSNENNIQVIVKENFGQISDLLFRHLYLQK
ncbi:MAG: hypothetical protein GC180_02500 [Bacteroidetes bacterium]|nr:hypothetical protein [Bacteroidota bacterium]